MQIATSKNLTVLGVLTILGALISAGVAVFDGDPSTNVDLNLLFVTIASGVGQLLAKGAQSTHTQSKV